MTDLITWLRSALDLEQAHAEKDLWALNRATPGVWTAHYGYNLPYSLLKGEGDVEIARFTAGTVPLPDGADDLHAADILLVARLVRKARERAERTLRTVAAHREILDRHAPKPLLNNDGLRVIATECQSCIDEIDFWNDDLTRKDWPCPDVRSLAAIYRDQHPGFDPDWLRERS